MQDATSLETTTRVAYIRTILDKDSLEKYSECNWLNLNTWLSFWVGQTIPVDRWGAAFRQRTKPPPGLRHHYILGYSNPADKVILDWLIWCSGREYHKLLRHDFTVYLSESQQREPGNKQLLDRLRTEKVNITFVTPSTPTEYVADDICDGVMLSKSDYVLETGLMRASSSGIALDAFYRDSLRHNHPQQYTPENLGKLHFEERLKNKMGHTRRDCSYAHAKSDAWKRDHEIAWKNYKLGGYGKNEVGGGRRYECTETARV
ncbi:hypothetical protein QYS62_006459 [Fusarium acuminatum]|uniref:Uncharacterized protein n=1 Tax=Fusarium acuminatum TaxID=5515 RepID=A0ABZ2WXI8_9HYPO